MEESLRLSRMPRTLDVADWCPQQHVRMPVELSQRCCVDVHASWRSGTASARLPIVTKAAISNETPRFWCRKRITPLADADSMPT